MIHAGRLQRTRRRMTVAIALAITTALVSGASIASGAPGDLAYQGCQSAETESGPTGTNACSPIGTPAAGGLNTGLNNVRGTAVSPDGTSVYTTASADSAIASFVRDTATGALTYQGCISGMTTAAPCTQLASATANGDNSGIGGTQGIAVSPDGNSVYVTATFDAAVARFDRDPATGALTYQGCISGETQSATCTQLPHASSGGVDSGLSDPQSIAATNTSLYVAARSDDAVARLSRTPGGAIAWQDCISGETQSGPIGSNACSLVFSATSSGTNSGLDVLQSVALSPDGASLYATSQGDSAVARFDRDTSTGDTGLPGLHHRRAGERSGAASARLGRLRGDPKRGLERDQLRDAVAIRRHGQPRRPLGLLVGGERRRARLVRARSRRRARPTRAASAARRRRPAPRSRARRPPGTTPGCASCARSRSRPSGGSVYMTASADDTVARFSRDAASGAIGYVGCITGEAETGPTGTNACTAIPSATAGGTNSGLDNPQSFAISPDGVTLYYGAANDAGIARFAIEPEPAGEAGDTTPPDTQITDHPKKKTKKKRARFDVHVERGRLDASSVGSTSTHSSPAVRPSRTR